MFKQRKLAIIGVAIVAILAVASIGIAQSGFVLPVTPKAFLEKLSKQASQYYGWYKENMSLSSAHSAFCQAIYAIEGAKNSKERAAARKKYSEKLAKPAILDQTYSMTVGIGLAFANRSEIQHYKNMAEILERYLTAVQKNKELSQKYAAFRSAYDRNLEAYAAVRESRNAFMEKWGNKIVHPKKNQAVEPWDIDELWFHKSVGKLGILCQTDHQDYLSKVATKNATQKEEDMLDQQFRTWCKDQRLDYFFDETTIDPLVNIKRIERLRAYSNKPELMMKVGIKCAQDLSSRLGRLLGPRGGQDQRE